MLAKSPQGRLGVKRPARGLKRAKLAPIYVEHAVDNNVYNRQNPRQLGLCGVCLAVKHFGHRVVPQAKRIGHTRAQQRA